MPFATKQQAVQAIIKLERAKKALQGVIDELQAVKDIGEEAEDVYVGYDMRDKLYEARRLRGKLVALISQYEAGPDVEDVEDVEDDSNELESIYSAQDAAHEARYGRMGDDDPYDD